jgi:dipeptidase E
MKLVLYSGYDEDNDSLDREVVRLIQKPNPTVTFIPSAHYVPEYEYRYFCDTFSDYGINNIQVFNVDQPYSASQAAQILKSDMIYLSGGNTFYFLKALRSHGFDVDLVRYVQRGGVLSGLSAGAIVMTKTIETASYPRFDRDENLVGLPQTQWSALGLCNFDFFPHYDAEPEYAKELLKASKKLTRPIYGVADGGGIVVQESRLSFFGDVWCYVSGREFKLN